MENTRRKPGRPKASTRTTPLVLDADFNLTKIDVALPASTVKTLTEYATWVQRCGDMTAEAATTATVDFALREVFRRDHLWRDERRIPERRPPENPAATTTPALPPPTGTPRDPRLS
ncbi:MAG: hypothetical protein ABUS79_14235 [Pseudomonadota bacterium]